MLQCPRCDGKLRVLSVITEPETIAHVLPALGLPINAPSARDPTDLLDIHQDVPADFV